VTRGDGTTGGLCGPTRLRNVLAGFVKAVAEKDAKALVDYYETDASGTRGALVSPPPSPTSRRATRRSQPRAPSLNDFVKCIGQPREGQARTASTHLRVIGERGAHR
jgi:hypothetical protein